ncbi:MAG: TrmH family RNA methyltransferase [Candidatus Ancillula sp.]|jgi:tRNA G18 (ribose-2'-O)-methylase SpoU|nr:TrmH family RNA methyltransferase [Candidatus Ancillula sp.]
MSELNKSQKIDNKSDTRNLQDRFKGMSVEDIVAELDKNRKPLQIAIENWTHDFNIGSIVRTANTFNVSKIHIIGKKRWNARGAMCTNLYMNIVFHSTINEFEKYCEDNSPEYDIIGIDCLEGVSIPLEKTNLPTKSILLFGAEKTGLTKEAQKLALNSSGKILHITQYGSTRSINAGHAAAIAMYEWIRQNQ